MLYAIDQAAVVLAAIAAVLLVMERDAKFVALVTEIAHSVHVQRAPVRTALAARDDPGKIRRCIFVIEDDPAQ